MDQQKLTQLLNALYSGSENASIQEASRQLNAWQQTSEAWSQADMILSSQGLPAEYYYFFAQTLKTKIQYDMYQLGDAGLISLRDSLIRKLLAVMHNSAAKPTRNQLCLALADLSIQAIEVWTNPITDFIQLLQADHLLELLEILKLMPEETENLKLMTENSKRNLSRQRCIENYYMILQFLDSRFSSGATPDIMRSILNCFLAWLKFDAPPIQYSMMDSPILNYCLSEINRISPNDLSVEEIEVDILSEVVGSASAYRSRSAHNPLVEVKIFPQISALSQVLLRTNLEQALMSDEESLKSLARLLVVTGEGIQPQIAASYATDARLQEFLMVLVRIFSLKNLSISDSIAPFFEDFINATVIPGRYGEVSVVHERLFEVITARIDIATEKTFNGSDPFDSVDSDFFHFRAKTLLPMLYTLSRDFFGRSAGAEKLVRGLIHNVVNSQSFTLQEAFALAVRDQLAGLSEPSASLVTAVDYLIESLMQWIDVSTIHSCNLIDAFRRRSFLALIGSLGNWIRTEAQLFKVIDSVAQVLIRPAVVHRSLHYAAAHSFREICFNRNSRNMIVSNAVAIESIAKLLSQTSAHLAMREQSEVTEGITSILSVCENDVLFCSLIRDTILIPLVQELETAKLAGDISKANAVVDRLTAVVRSLSKLRPGSPRSIVMEEIVTRAIWPTLSVAMEPFRAEADFAEKSCRLIKHCLRCVPESFKQLIVPVGQLLIRDFSSAQHSSYLYMAEVLAQEYGQEPDMRLALSELFSSLASEGVRITQQRMQATAFGADNVDELIEDLYGMIERFLRYCPTIVVKSRQALKAILDLLIPVYGRMRRAETIEAVSAFVEGMYSGEWTHTIDIGTVSNEEVMSIRSGLHTLAPALVQQLFVLLLSVCNRPMRQAIPSLLIAINGFDQAAFRSDWIVRGLQQIPASVMTDRDKQAALHALVNLDDERSLNNAVEDILYRAELVGRRMRNETK
jgi:transportin-3